MLLVVVLIACAALPQERTAEKEPDTVRALRFRQLIVDSALEYSHGGGAWYDVLYLPQEKLVAQVVWESEFRWEPKLRIDEHPRMYAFEGKLEDELAARPQDDPQAKIQPVEIRIPAKLANAIADLAELTRRQREAAVSLARQCVDEKLVGGKDSVRPRKL